MLKGFFNETKPLTQVEKQMLPHIVKGLSVMIGASNAITNKQIADKVFKKHGVHLSEARIRKIINHIRINYLVPGLVANGCGYYISRNPNEVKAYIQSLLGREKAIQKVREKTQVYYNEITKQSQNQFSFK